MPHTKLHNTDFTLYALFCLSRLNLPVDPGTLGRLMGKPDTEIASDLRQLGQLGRVASSQAGVRLTMLGLARAAKLEPMVGRASLNAGLSARVTVTKASARVLQARQKEIKPLVAAKPRMDARDDVRDHAADDAGDEQTKLSA